MEIKAVLGFAIFIGLLVLGLGGMFVLGRSSRRKRWPTDAGHVGDGGAWSGAGGDGGGASTSHSSHGGHSDGGGHGGH
jgi:hypothetical protein